MSEQSIILAIRALEKMKKTQNLVMRADSRQAIKTSIISTGSLGLDIVLGIGGWPRGRIVEIIGPESVGKTTLALQAIANAQAQGLVGLYIDAEHALDLGYAESLGVDLSRLYISQPDDGTQAMDVLLAMLKTGAFGIAVVDSVSALTPKNEAEGQVSDQEIGSQARLMSKALRMLTPWVRKSNCCLIFLNQVRYKVGVMYGNPETTSGGNALMHYASIRVKMTRQLSQEVKGQEEERIGNQVTVSVIKNKLAMPFKKTTFDILYGRGVDRYSELVFLGLKYNLLTLAGSWYSYHDEKLGQGKDNVKQYLISHPEIATRLEEDILSQTIGTQEIIPEIEEDSLEEDLEAVEEA